MAEPRDPGSALARQLRLHLESLRAAGIEFVPVVAPMTFPPVEPRAPTAAEPEPVPEPDPFHTQNLFPSSTDLQPDDRRHELTVLAERIAPCDRCPELFSTRTQTVFGVGPIDPDICFVGEAPGADEDAQGEPFVGKAGQLLNKIIVAMGFKRNEVYICNTLKCRPPNNRTPTPQERSNCREYFDQQLELVKPKYIVALGLTAAQNLLATTLSMGKLRGRFHRFGTVPVICTYHPAALLRNEGWKKDTWDDMKLLLREMGRPIPSKGNTGN
jgi:DNA polymerase